MSNNSCNNIVSRSYASVNANYNVLALDYFILCTANSFDVTLPTAVGRQNKIYEVNTPSAKAEGFSRLRGLHS